MLFFLDEGYSLVTRVLLVVQVVNPARAEVRQSFVFTVLLQTAHHYKILGRFTITGPGYVPAGARSHSRRVRTLLRHAEVSRVCLAKPG